MEGIELFGCATWVTSENGEIGEKPVAWGIFPLIAGGAHGRGLPCSATVQLNWLEIRAHRANTSFFFSFSFFPFSAHCLITQLALHKSTGWLKSVDFVRITPTSRADLIRSLQSMCISITRLVYQSSTGIFLTSPTSVVRLAFLVSAEDERGGEVLTALLIRIECDTLIDASISSCIRWMLHAM